MGKVYGQGYLAVRGSKHQKMVGCILEVERSSPCQRSGQEESGAGRVVALTMMDMATVSLVIAMRCYTVEGKEGCHQQQWLK